MGSKPDFVRERAAKFNQRAPVVQTVAVEETIEPSLNPFAEGLEKKCSDDDGDDAADGAVAGEWKDLRNERDKQK